MIESLIDDSNDDVIFDALWSAYLLYLSPKRREFAEKWMADAKNHSAKGGAPDPLKPAESGPETMTAASQAEPMPAPTSTGSISGPSLDTTSASPIANSAS